ncbi:MAG: rhodanese-like domain-containing protein [Verrucomicrobia bacterium]|nr:rhodanese-like domain-containing protein [Verrucomicrobiota bacterium]
MEQRDVKKRSWPEWLFVIGLGLALAVILNHHSGKGLDITRDYFPSTQLQLSQGEQASPDTSPKNSSSTFEAEIQQSIERLMQKGFQPVSSLELAALIEDPRLESGQVVLIDARNEALFQERHIPAAYLFDHYQMDQYVDLVLPMCQIAEQVIVYCSGGHCEDSEFAATDLQQLGVPLEKLYIYAAGMRGWNEGGYPIATGDRFDDLEELLATKQNGVVEAKTP